MAPFLFLFLIRVLKGNRSIQIFRDFNLDFWGQIQKSGQKKKEKKMENKKKTHPGNRLAYLIVARGFLLCPGIWRTEFWPGLLTGC